MRKFKRTRHLDQSHASPPSTALEWWCEDLDLDRTIPHSQKQQSSWSCCQPWWQSRHCATVFWDSSFVWDSGRNWRLGNGVTVMVVSQGLGKASWMEGGWNGSSAARRRIKDLAWSEMGVHTNSKTRFWGWYYAERGQWYCRHEKRGCSGERRWRCLCRERVMSLCFTCVCIWKPSYLSTRRRWLSL